MTDPRPPAGPTPETLARLAFVKHLLGVGVEQSRAPAPLSAACILTFHDAIELFNQLAAETLGADMNKDSFLSYWPRISKVLPNGASLPMQAAATRLNRARVSLKHHGLFPTETDIEALRASVTAFFEESAPLAFGVRFRDLSLVSFVKPESARNELRLAEGALGSGDVVEAAKHVGVAFAYVLRDYEWRQGAGQSPFDLKPPDADTLWSLGLPRDLENFVNTTSDALDELRWVVRILALGIDFRKYLRFRSLASEAHALLNGEVRPNDPPWLPENAPGLEDLQFCIDFVIGTAISFSSFDYSARGTS